jgi:hypothetical protein
MTTIFELVADALDAISPAVPFALAPYLTAPAAALPDVYLTYQLIDGSPQQHADDAEVGRSYQIQVSIYSRTGLASLPDVDDVMIDAGFTKSSERQLPKDPTTGHYGLAKDYYFYQTG